MIILMHAEKWPHPEDAVEVLKGIAGEARIPERTQIVFEPGLPEVDADENPIFAFKVSGGEIHYWRGEPIKFEFPNDK